MVTAFMTDQRAGDGWRKKEGRGQREKARVKRPLENAQFGSSSRKAKILTTGIH
jgi:hypothetical protein